MPKNVKQKLRAYVQKEAERGARVASSPGPPEKLGKGSGSASVHFLLTITSSNFEEPIKLQNETTQNVIPSHAHEAKSVDYAIWRVARDGVLSVS